jgi:hypothetical protein
MRTPLQPCPTPPREVARGYLDVGDLGVNDVRRLS